MIGKIITARLTLQIVDDQDAEFIKCLVNTEGWIKFIGDRKIYSNEDAVNYIRRINQTEHFTYWVVRITETNTPVGVISFLKRPYLDHFDLGFAFLPEYNGKGYAYEAASEVLSILRRQEAHREILATTIPGNANSIKLLRKLGFHLDKEIRLDDERIEVYTTGLAGS